ncbi:MAG: Rpn family recombination-promoting nuclease/putative transposase [Pseudarcicella sp.]|jgi:predicted transposase/invertase (TIGR01784 family)|nr:Rpn family recombination-promoting nuclease/putative transposase [Pseudarcicella sp.]MBP6409744.1 Rpn family recombination-promoting nuclease/putative transposase [Pseudarcicella sp.]
MKFVDIKNDVAFRKIFGNENRKEVLISFLNAVLLLESNCKIVDVVILTPYQLPDLKGGKVTIVDIKAKDINGKEYIVEMQVAEVDAFDKRVLYYASKSYSAQIERGDQYENLNPTYFIGILDFEATQNPSYISRHKIIDIETNENYIKDIEFNFIELPKFNKQESELNSVVDQWVYFIKNAENLNLIPDNLTDTGLRFAYEDASKHNWTKAELEAYDYALMREQDEKGRMNATIKNIARSLFKSSLSDVEIAQHTKLSLDQIQKMRSGLN